MPTNEERSGQGAALVRRLRERLSVDLTGLRPADQALVGGALLVFDRAARVFDKLEAVADAQLEVTRLSRQVIGMFPPIIGKLGALVDLELEAARERLGRRGR